MNRFLVWILLLCSCATQNTNQDSIPLGEGETKTIEPASIPGFNAEEYGEAQFFQNWIQGKVSVDEKKGWIKKCRKKNSAHTFCSSMLQSRYYEARHKEEAAEPSIPPVRNLVIPEIVWKGSKITNWKSLRKEKVSTLVKSLEKLSPEEVERVAQFAEKEKRCPNPLAAAVAARFEDFNDAGHVSRSAVLYTKSARCAPRKSPDREQLLTRAALLHIRANQYGDAEKILVQVKPQDALAGRPLYWLVRSQLQLGKKEKAKANLSRLLRQHPFSFHALIARYQFQRPFPGEWFNPGKELASRSTRNKKANSTINQIELCAKYKLRDCQEAISQFALEKVKKVESPTRAYVATFAHPTMKVRYLQEIVLGRSDMRYRQVFEQLYPRPFQNVFESSSDSEAALLFAVARKESQFDDKAVSVAQAFGLLQLQVPTAKRYRSDVEAEALFSPDVNVPIAAKYLRDLKERYSGDLVSMLAAYNAGEDAVTRWKDRYQINDPILFMDIIPYRETRDYVGYVLSNLLWYRRLYYGDANPVANLFPTGAVAIQSVE